MFNNPTKPKSYKEKQLRNLLKTKRNADCTFIFKDKQIPAHRLLLANCSEAFDTMFYGSLPETEIRLPDIHSSNFERMLEYVYTDDVNIGTVNDAWDLMYISTKYFIDDLSTICVDYVKLHLRISNLLLNYEYGLMYNRHEFVKLCFHDILRYLKGLLTCDYHMKDSTLLSILTQTDINASTSDLVILSVKWAVEECVNNGRETTALNIWNILSENDLLKYLNFDAFDELISFDFSELQPHYPKIIELYNKVAELKHTYGRGTGNSIQEKIKPNAVNYKFRDIYRIAKNVIFTDVLSVKSDITCSKPIFVFAIAVTTLHRPQKAETTSYVGRLRIKFMQGNCRYYDCVIEEQDLEYDHVQLINLPIPVKLENNLVYSIIIVYNNEPLFERGEVILHYLSQKVVDKRSTTVIDFSDEIDGSVLQAVSFYPA